MLTTIGHEFMVKTRYENLQPSAQTQQLPQPPLEARYDEIMVIDLPMPEEIPAITIDFMAAIELRTSVRDYQQQPLSLLELSFLLWCTQGVKQVLGGGKATLRTVPSAGARHAFETYLLINNVEGVKPGLYRFLAIEHKLALVNGTATISREITEACLEQKFISNSAVTFLWVADVARMTWRYGERGYRYLHLDAGHICQNLYLAAQVIGCGVCAIAAFDDEKLNRTMGIDGEEQFALYVGTVGKK